MNESTPSRGMPAIDHSNSGSMNDHFTALSDTYNHIRDTDSAPVSFIANQLKDRKIINGADIGCGAGRYDLLLLRQLPTLDLTCCDSNEKMLTGCSNKNDRLAGDCTVGSRRHSPWVRAGRAHRSLLAPDPAT